MVIVAFNTFDTGQPDLALVAAVSNACLSAPGIFARTSRWTAVIANPPSVLSNDTDAVV